MPLYIYFAKWCLPQFSFSSISPSLLGAINSFPRLDQSLELVISVLKIHAEGMGLGTSFTVYMKGRMIGKEKESERDLPSADPLLKCPCVSGLDQAETRSQELWIFHVYIRDPGTACTCWLPGTVLGGDRSDRQSEMGCGSHEGV